MLAVSIVTYHTPTEELDRLLVSLSSPLIDRVYVIDNGREERLRSWCGKFDRIAYIESPNNGYGAGHNIALRRSIEDGLKYHLAVNSDVYFNPAIIDEICSYMDCHDDIGTLQPKIVNPDGSLQFTCRRLPTPFDVFARRFLPKFLYKRRDDKYLLKHLDHEMPHNIPYHQGSFMFLRVEALSEAGLFDERYFMYPEDIDLTRRIHRNWITLYYPYATVVHDHRAASYHSFRMTKIHVMNMMKYFNKWGWWIDKERRKFNNAIR